MRGFPGFPPGKMRLVSLPEQVGRHQVALSTFGLLAERGADLPDAPHLPRLVDALFDLAGREDQPLEAQPLERREVRHLRSGDVQPLQPQPFERAEIGDLGAGQRQADQTGQRLERLDVADRRVVEPERVEKLSFGQRTQVGHARPDQVELLERRAFERADVFHRCLIQMQLQQRRSCERAQVADARLLQVERPERHAS